MASPICIRLSEKELKIIDEYGSARKLNRSDVLRELILKAAVSPFRDDQWMVKAFTHFKITMSQLRFAMSQKSLTQMFGYIAEKNEGLSIMALGNDLVITLEYEGNKFASKVYSSMSNADAMESVCSDFDAQMLKAFMGE